MQAGTAILVLVGVTVAGGLVYVATRSATAPGSTPENGSAPGGGPDIPSGAKPGSLYDTLYNYWYHALGGKDKTQVLTGEAAQQYAEEHSGEPMTADTLGVDQWIIGDDGKRYNSRAEADAANTALRQQKVEQATGIYNTAKPLPAGTQPASGTTKPRTGGKPGGATPTPTPIQAPQHASNAMSIGPRFSFSATG